MTEEEPRIAALKKRIDALEAFLIGPVYQMFEADRKVELTSVETQILQGDIKNPSGEKEDWLLRGYRQQLIDLAKYFPGLRDSLKQELEKLSSPEPELRETNNQDNEDDSE